MNKPGPTIVLSIRLRHTDLATLLDFYESEGITIKAISQLAKFAITDFAQIILHNNKSKSYDLPSAIERLSHLRQQRSNARRLSHTLGLELALSTRQEMSEFPSTSLPSPREVIEMNKLMSEPDLSGVINSNQSQFSEDEK